MSVNPPTLAQNAFDSSSINNGYIYVPDSSVTNYQAAENWSSYSSVIKGVSQLQTDNPSLYEEVAEYL